MLGDGPDMARRLRAVLPRGWFGDTTPVLDTMLNGLGAGFSAFWQLLQFVSAQSRLATTTGIFLDSFANDFFGSTVVRHPGENDNDYRTRVGQDLLRPRTTRNALNLVLTQITGQAPAIFEPMRSADTGAYSSGGLGYGVAGGWGNLNLPYQVFVTSVRPVAPGIAEIYGYGTGGYPAYGDLTQATGGAPDADVFAAVHQVLPAGSICWLRLLP